MKNKIKISFIIVLAVLLGTVYSTACFLLGDTPTEEAGNLVTVREDQQEEEFDINEKLDILKEGLVDAPVIVSHESGEQLLGSGDKETIFLVGTTNPENSIEISVNGLYIEEEISADTNGNFETINGIDIIEGKNLVEVIAVDPSGNKSNPTKLTLNLMVPEKVEYTLYNNQTDLKEISSIYYTSDYNPVVYLEGNYIPLATTYVQVNDVIVGETIADSEGVFVLEEVQLDTGDNEVAVWAVTGDGYTSSPVYTSITVYKDMITPYPSNLTGYHNQDANYIDWSASIDDNFESYKVVRTEEPCVNPDYPADAVIATITDQNAVSYIDSELDEGRSYYYTVWTLDKAGHVVSSNVLALPKPVYTVSITKLDSFTDYSVNRREWYYQYFEITNTGNVTLDLQPIMAWITLDPEADDELSLMPYWEVHLWNPEDAGVYYYSDEEVYSTYVSDWVNTSGSTTTESEEVFDYANATKTVTTTVTEKQTELGGLNLKRVMTVDVTTTVTEYDISTTPATVNSETTSYDTSTQIVGPEEVGSIIEDIEPGEKVKIGVKIQNVSAPNNAEITVHFNFAPVDCDGRYYTDEIISTGDVYCKSSDRNQ